MFSVDDYKFILVFLLLVALMYISCEPSSIHRMNRKGKGKDGDDKDNDVRNNSRAMM